MSCIKSNLLIYGDNIQAFKLLSRNHVSGIKLAYLDPPYCSNTNNEHYSDCFHFKRYESYLKDVIRRVLHLLDDSGIIAIQIDSMHSFTIKNMMDRIIGSRNFKGQIVVGKNDHKRYCGNIEKMISGYDCLLIYTKRHETKLPPLIEREKDEQDGEWSSFYTTSPIAENRYCVFGIDIKVGSWRKSSNWAATAIANYQALEQFILKANLSKDDMEQCIHCYRDCNNLENKDLEFLRCNNHIVEYYLPPSCEKHLSDNWSDINIRGNNTYFEHEVSEVLFTRLFNWLTLRDDIILDPFLGSGTSIIVASRLNRKWIGIERESYCKSEILERIKDAEIMVNFYEIN